MTGSKLSFQVCAGARVDMIYCKTLAYSMKIAWCPPHAYSCWVWDLACATFNHLHGEDCCESEMDVEKGWDVRDSGIHGRNFNMDPEVDRVRKDEHCPEASGKLRVHDLCNFLLNFPEEFEALF